MVDINQYFITYVNYPLINNKNKKKHIEYFENNFVFNYWGPKIDLTNYLKKRFEVGLKDIELKRHDIFHSVLTQISTGTHWNNIKEKKYIEAEVLNNQPRRLFRFDTDKKAKLEIAETWNPIQHLNEGDLLYHLACHSLLGYLKVYANKDNIKKCVYCHIYFIAKNKRAEICGTAKCMTKQKSAQKAKLRKQKKFKTFK